MTTQSVYYVINEAEYLAIRYALYTAISKEGPILVKAEPRLYKDLCDIFIRWRKKPAFKPLEICSG